MHHKIISRNNFLRVTIKYFALLLLIGLWQETAIAISLDSAKNLVVSNEVAGHIPTMLGFYESPDISGVSYTGTYNDNGWTLRVDDTYLSKPLNLTYIGTFDSSRNLITWNGNGTYDKDPWTIEGKVQFSGSNDEVMQYEENGQIGSESWRWWLLGGEVLTGVVAGVIGSPPTGLVVGGALVSASGVVIAIDAVENPPKPDPPEPGVLPGPNGDDIVKIENVSINGGNLNINKNISASGYTDGFGNGSLSLEQEITGSGRFVDGMFEGDVGVVPLPAALPLFASGLGVLVALGRRKKRKIVTAPRAISWNSGSANMSDV